MDWLIAGILVTVGLTLVWLLSGRSRGRLGDVDMDRVRGEHMLKYRNAADDSIRNRF